MLALGTLPTVWVPPRPIRGLRALVGYRDKLVRQRIRYQNQAKAVLTRDGHKVARNADIRRWLLEHPDALPQADHDRLVLSSTVRMLAMIDQEVRQLESAIAEQASQVSEIRLLMSITGVGLIAAAVIWARIGDASHFRSPKAVARYAGLDPSVHQSGEEDRRGHISKAGAGDLRRILVQAAYQAARHDTGLLGVFFHRKEKQLGRKRAVIALARKLIVVAWRILLTGKPYRFVKTDRYREKLRALEQTATSTTSARLADIAELMGRTQTPSDKDPVRPAGPLPGAA